MIKKQWITPRSIGNKLSFKSSEDRLDRLDSGDYERRAIGCMDKGYLAGILYI